MKILFFLHSLSAGGAERVTVNLANYWVRKGNHVSIVTLTGRDRDFYGLDPRIDRVALHKASESHSTLAAMLHNVSRIRALRGVLRRVKPDVAIGMSGAANCLVALAALGTGILVVGSERVHPPTVPLGRAWEGVRLATYRLLDCVVAQTERSAAWVRHHTLARRVVAIPNPIDFPLRSSEPRVPPPKFDRAPTTRTHLILSVGRAAHQKGFDRLLFAFAALAPRFPDWYLAILGEGGLHADLCKQAVELRLADRVQLPGAVGNVGEWYAAADLFVLSSRFEGFPNVLLEALAYGVPVVSVDCETGPSEIVRHEIDGLLVPQNDHEALIQALERLMADDELRRSCASRATEARERFAMDRIAGVWEDLFEDLAHAEGSILRHDDESV